MVFATHLLSSCARTLKGLYLPSSPPFCGLLVRSHDLLLESRATSVSTPARRGPDGLSFVGALVPRRDVPPQSPPLSPPTRRSAQPFTHIVCAPTGRHTTHNPPIRPPNHPPKSATRHERRSSLSIERVCVDG